MRINLQNLWSAATQMGLLGTAWEDTVMEIVFTTLSRYPTFPPKHNQRLYIINNISHWKYNFKVYLIYEKAMVHLIYKFHYAIFYSF